MTKGRRVRMAELERLSGVPRETIHFYLRSGLLPPPDKTGKTQATYDERHLERLRLIRRLREEKYLPIAVIRTILKAGPELPKGRDLETLTDVLSLDPTLIGEHTPPPAADEESVRVALELGLLGAGVNEANLDDPTQRRVLSSVAEALGLRGDAQRLTLDDLQVCARELTRLVEAEGRVFFDLVQVRGDLGDAVHALRSGRGIVARYIGAYRDWMLRRLVEQLLTAVAESRERIESAKLAELGTRARRRTGADAHEKELAGRASAGDPAAANDLVWHCFTVGPRRRLKGFAKRFHPVLRPRARLLVEVASDEVGAIDPSPDFPLGRVLAAERALLRAIRDGEGRLLERAVPALHLFETARPEHDADPLASALALLRRGLVRLALPEPLGRAEAGEHDLEQALGVLLAAPGRVHAAARATIEGNARLALGRRLADRGDPRAVESLERARDLDPAGPIGAAAETRLTALASA